MHFRSSFDAIELKWMALIVCISQQRTYVYIKLSPAFSIATMCARLGSSLSLRSILCTYMNTKVVLFLAGQNFGSKRELPESLKRNAGELFWESLDWSACEGASNLIHNPNLIIKLHGAPAERANTEVVAARGMMKPNTLLHTWNLMFANEHRGEIDIFLIWVQGKTILVI